MISLSWIICFLMLTCTFVCSCGQKLLILNTNIIENKIRRFAAKVFQERLPQGAFRVSRLNIKDSLVEWRLNYENTLVTHVLKKLNISLHKFITKYFLQCSSNQFRTFVKKKDFLYWLPSSEKQRGTIWKTPILWFVDLQRLMFFLHNLTARVAECSH